MYRFEAELWEHEGEAPWPFVTLPEEIDDEIRARSDEGRKVFGSVPVDVVIGETRWSTSLYPDARSQPYLLPVEKSVRSVETLTAGDIVGVEIELRG